MQSLSELIGDSPQVVAIRQQVERLLARQSASRAHPSILIQGETGTGKGVLARAMHAASARSGEPFVEVNCAAIPETLLEAELFGYERGAFTDARQAKAGLFQAAHHGTIFLDEVGLLPAGLQAKLLTVVQERIVRRLGGIRGEPVDVWIVTATNEDLVAATRAGRFREDLYHRLAVLTLVLPPLRDRGDDVLLLAEHFLGRACADYRLPAKSLAADARGALLGHPWPGNVRELANLMERAALMSEETTLTAASLGLTGVPAVAGEGRPPDAGPATPRAAPPLDREQLLDALRETGGNLSRAAARLGVPRNTRGRPASRPTTSRPRTPPRRRWRRPACRRPPSCTGSRDA